MEFDPTNITLELEAGVSQSRLAQLADISASTLRGYEKDGLIPTQIKDGKKAYGLQARTALETIKNLRATGMNLNDIANQLKQSKINPPKLENIESDLRAQIEILRAKLNVERAKIEALAAKTQMRVIVYRNELVLSKKELAEIERLREVNIQRALKASRRASAIQYAQKHNVIELNPTKIKKV